MLVSDQFLLIFFYIAVSYSLASSSDKVRLTDVQVLTLYKNQYTTGRRNQPVPQLKCVGGNAGCDAVDLVAVQCYNRGFDGSDVQWECKTDMDNAYRFGALQVSCEGYDYPDDPYILKGSCGLEYTIDYLTKDGQQYGKDGSYSYPRTKKSSILADVVFWIIIGLFIFVLYRICTGPQRTPSSRGGGSTGYGGDGPPPPPPGYRPDFYSGDDSCHRSSYDSYGSSFGGGGGRPGFWSGLGAGGLLGYMFGNRGNTFGAGQNYWGSPGPSYGRSSGSGFSPSFAATGSSRTASGYGGTRRR